MDSEFLKIIVQEFASTIDDSLLPQTSISSLGLRLALKLKPELDVEMRNLKHIEKHQAFAQIIKKLLEPKFDYYMQPSAVQNDKIRLNINQCPFKPWKSPSLCSAMYGALGGLAFMTFGYCKVIMVSGPKNIAKPCCIDLYLKKSAESDSLTGIEYTKNEILFLGGNEDKLVNEQRMARRKLILGLFINIAFALREKPSDKILAQRFMEALSCIPGVSAALIYLKDNDNLFKLAADFGIPEEITPAIRNLDDRDIDDDVSWDRVISADKLDPTSPFYTKKTSIKFVTTARIKSSSNIYGMLFIGWNLATPITPELSEAIRAATVLLGSIIERTKLYNDLESQHMESIFIINDIVKIVDPFACNHAENVAVIARSIAEQMGLDKEDVNRVYEGCLIHDLGKITIPYDILNKTDRLTDEEFAIVKNHPEAGAKLLSAITSFKEIVPIVLYHHERLDGSGYPFGLKGNQIPLIARIAAVADTYDAMISERAHRKAFGKYDAINQLLMDSGSKFDPDVVDALISIVENENHAAS